MTYDDDELPPLSGIQHYSFCPRQWALIHVAQEWAENALTVQGGIVHKRAHDASLREWRRDTIELRCVLVDRFVVTSINNRVVSRKDFVELETGEVRLTDAGRKRLFEAWQERKREQITHPYLKEKIDRGLVPHVQALLLAQYVRGDLDDYPAFLWK